MGKSSPKKEVELMDVQPLYSIENNLLVFKNGRVGVGFEIYCIEMEKPTHGLISELGNSSMMMLKDLPPDTVVQKMDTYFDMPYKVSVQDLKYYEGKIHAKFLDRPILKHRSYIFFSFPIDEKQPKRNPLTTIFAGVKNYLPKNPFDGIERRMIEAERASTKAIQTLISGNTLKFKRLEDEDLASLYYQYLNLDFTKEHKSLIRNHENDISYLGVGEKKANFITMIGQGLEVDIASPSFGEVISPFSFPLTHYLQFPHIYLQTIRIEDQKEMMNTLDIDFKINNGLSSNGFFGTKDHGEKAIQLEDFTSEVRRYSKQLVNFNVSVIVYSPNDNERLNMIEDVAEAFGSLNGAEVRIEGNDTANLFYASCPGNGWDTYRWIPSSSDFAVKYFNFISNYKSDKTGVLLCDRFRNPLRVNLFNVALNNQNSITIGPSGSGKSYTQNYFIIQRFEQDARQIIIDKGGTYKSLVTALKGRYFEYSPENPIAFNPFLLEKDQNGKYRVESRINKGKLLCLSTIIKLIWKGEGEMSQAEKSIISQLLPEYYEYLNTKESVSPSLNNFIDYVGLWIENAMLDKEGRDQLEQFNHRYFFTCFKPYTEGLYKDLLNAKVENDISDEMLTCFDMDRIKDDENIYQIVTTLIVQLVLDQTSKYPEVIKYVYMDEAWSMIKGNMGDFIEHMFRTIRKNNGSINLITQGIDEIIKSTAGKAMLLNCSIRIILNHSEDDLNGVDRMSEVMGFTNYEIEKIRSLRKGDGFRDIAIKAGDTMNVYALEASDQIAMLASSTPLERDNLRKQFALINDMGIAAEIIAEDKRMKRGVFKND